MRLTRHLILVLEVVIPACHPGARSVLCKESFHSRGGGSSDDHQMIRSIEICTTSAEH